VCDRVAILQDGELKRVGTLQELSAGGQTRFTVKNLPAAVMEPLMASSAQVTLAQGQAVIHCPDDASRKNVEALLQTHSVEILQMDAETQSLEKIFFSTIQPPPKL
jgi:ABC-2 type transport system ATP-binding protein